jgi:2'-5' RNA ligase
MRLFVAVDLPPGLRAALGAHTAAMARTWPAAKWVAAENLHLTVRFIGDWDRGRLAPLESALASAAARHRPFALTLRGAGFFGSPAAPRVVWAGVADGDRELAAVASSVDGALAELGVRSEGRPYRAHLTLARGRGDPIPADLRQQLGDLQAHDWGRLAVDRIALFASALLPTGPVYSQVSSFILGCPGAAGREKVGVVQARIGCYTQLEETGSR